ncbi:fluoride efflux transporter CrcB [Paenibacillus sp. YYML68]|uniref:fluoride efflux transporter CrcB n=1 Tax=Paenibacillus sp. YYML68 TaxID=2909250 RepID=UPI00249092CC|nr:fluoride efflux transporter CrcB [Paenibacillus sp. YYML68]
MSNIVISDLFAVAIGGSVGAMSRYAVSTMSARRYAGAALPVGTLLVNLLGSFLLGLLWGQAELIHEKVYVLLGTGFLGAFTTFSTFKVETEAMLHKGSRRTAAAYIAISYVAGVLLAWLGYMLSDFAFGL